MSHNFKCNISMSNFIIALKFYIEVKSERLDAQIHQCLDKHSKGVCDDTVVSPNYFKCNISTSNFRLLEKFAQRCSRNRRTPK